jgi:hypothetical protein
VLEYYKAMTNITHPIFKLVARQPVSLEIQHVTENLANKYAVTDKADGDRYFMIIYNNCVYLIPNTLVVRDTGIVLDKKLSKYNGSIMDGELIYNFEQLLPESKWDGVEISNHRISLKIRDVNIWQGNMLDENFRQYNILHADNLCLDNSVIEKLEEKIQIEFSGIYISYRKPTLLKFLKKSILLEVVNIETTWINHPIYFYKIN